MHPAHYTLSPALVCRQAVALLVTHLALPHFRDSVPAGLLARLLLWATATRRSLSALCGRSTRPPSDETARQARQAGVRPAWVLLDRGFYAADVVQWREQEQVAFVIPMIRRGREDRGTGTQRFFARDRATGWDTYTWTARPRRWDEAAGKQRKGPAVTVTVDVGPDRHRARPEKRPWVSIAHRVRWSPDLVRKRYRRRFGIETSYRQLRACLALTTSRDRRVRLLLIGLALFLRQWWVWLHWTALSVLRPDGRRRWQLGQLRLEDLKLWVHTALAQALGYVLEIRTQQPIPLVA